MVFDKTSLLLLLLHGCISQLLLLRLKLLGSQLSVVQYVAIVIAIVGSRSSCSCCGALVMVTKILIEDVSTLLMLIMNC